LKELQENRTIPAWVQESFRVAVDFAYAEDRVQFVFADALAAGNVVPSSIPALTPEYVQQARQIARRRLALAAWRLGDELRGAW
jgi:hypothetical protein